MDCPICEYPHVSFGYELSDRFFGTTSRKFSLHFCPSCGASFQEEDGLRENLSSFYPAGYWWEGEGALSGLEGKYREWMIRHDHLHFLTLGSSKPSQSRLLDIGCGSGTFVKMAAEAGFDAYGLEMSPEALEIAKRKTTGRVFGGEVSEMVERGEKYNVITLFHTLEHLLEPLQFLKRLSRILERPGTLIVQVPNSGSYQARLLGRRWYGLDCPRHIYNYSSFALLHLLGRAGYRIREVRFFSARDNAAALVSSLCPFLDPMSQRVKLMRKRGRGDSLILSAKKLLYFSLMLLAQPLAYIEAKAGRGATVMVRATLE
jgi:SAM-dependent methyltransferase